MSDLRRWFWRFALLAIVIIAILGVVVVYMFVTQDRHASSLYIVAVAGTSEDCEGKNLPVNVDVWLNDELRVHRASGAHIPIISVKPGHYTLKVTAPGYIPYVQRLDVLPPHSEEIYVCARLTPKSGEKSL